MKIKLAMLALCLATVSIANAFSTETITIKAKGYLPKDMAVTVITPDSIAPNGAPSVYLLNGYGGDNTSWTSIRPDLGNLADQYGFVMVLPSGMDTWYWDAPADPKVRMETFITDVLVPYIDKKYPTDPRAEKRAITGLSMGGHGGLWLGIRHPDIWKNCGSTSGGVNIEPFPTKWKMAHALGKYEKNPQRWRDHTVINLVPTMVAGTNNIIFDCGSEDFFAKVNADLHQALLDEKIPHDYISRPGVHNSAYWANSLPYQLLFFSTKFNEVQ